MYICVVPLSQRYPNTWFLKTAPNYVQLFVPFPRRSPITWLPNTAPNYVHLFCPFPTEVPQHLVAKHGSLPAQYLYNWAFVCLSLIEHTAKMTENRPGKVVSPGNNSEPIVDVGRFGHRSSITDTINTATNKTLGSGDV